MTKARAPIQSPLSWIAISGLVINAASWAWWIADRSRTPDPYAARHRTIPWVYPTDAVIGSVCVIAILVFLASFALRRTTSVPIASLILGVGFGVLFIAALPFAIMHAPTFIAGMLAHLLFAGGWLVLAALGTGITSLIATARAHDRMLRSFTQPDSKA